MNDSNSIIEFPQAQNSRTIKRIALTNGERRIVYEIILEKSDDGKLNKVATRDVESQL